MPVRALPLLAPVLFLALLLGGPARAADDAAPSVGEVALLMDRALPHAQRLELRYLLHLGWRFERDASLKQVVVDGGRPCRYRSLARAQAAGALRIRVPSSFGAAEARTLGARLAAIADGIPSRCAYLHKLRPALRRAVDRFNAIVNSGRYEFPYLFEIWSSPFWGLRLPEHEWTKREEDGVYVATQSSSAAMEGLWRRGGVAECYTAQWLAIFGAQYELYGGPWFNKVFAPSELQIGKPEKIKPSPIGRTTRGEGPYDYRGLLVPPADQKKDPFLALAPHGANAFVGLTGIMRNQDADGAMMNENFTITMMSPAALDEIVRGGGVRYLRSQAAKAWKYVNDSMGPLRMFGEPSGKEAAAIDALLKRPAFTEVWVYVHPYGVVTFDELARKKYGNSSTAPEFVFYMHGREDFLYRRYHREWKKRCAMGGPCR